jgi:hypothetical protein
MTDPNEPVFTNACEAMQWEISQALDERRPLPENASLHIASCPECAHFARLWRDGGGPAAALGREPVFDPALCQRVLDRTLRGGVSAPRIATLSTHLTRWAAVGAFAALSWWLLDPREGSPRVRRAPRPEAPRLASPSISLDRQLARIEQRGDREKEVLRNAMIDGTARFRDVLAWSSEALE